MLFWAIRTIPLSANLVFSLKSMRTKRARRLPIPQHEFCFVPDTFTLMQENGLDGDRVALERDEADRARAIAEAAQAALFTTRKPDGD
jgi:hypothetical protein